jgi:hypothetical protein
MATRFDTLSPRACVAWLSLFLALFVASLTLNAKSIQLGDTVAIASAAKSGAPVGDAQLYQNIIDRVARGENYYKAAAGQHREGGFPLRPFVTVRPPTLAWTTATLGPMLTQVLAIVLIGSVLLSWFNVFRRDFEFDPAARATVMVTISSAALGVPVMILFHECWAALLIALSLALWRPNRYAASIAFGLLAVLIRDLAMPYLVLMAVAAAYDRRWREVGGWVLAGVIAGVALYVHAQAVAAILKPDDLVSPGWTGMGGWAFFVTAISHMTTLLLLPDMVARIAVPLSLFGWLSWKSDHSLRVCGLLAGYATLIMVFARPNNFYWGLLIAPLLLVGLCFAPAGLRALLKGSQLRWPATATGGSVG